ncbi:MAG: hypothetical protein ACRCTR_00905 [Actinomycetota bacterium]
MITDVELLRRFEPVVHFTQGEMFFPMAVEPYLQECSLWLRADNGEQRRLAAPGEVSADSLADLAQSLGGGVPYLRYVQRPLDLPSYVRWRRNPERPAFEAIGRWARVGLASRLWDAALDAASTIRGTVPGGTTPVAERQYRRAVESDPSPMYYARVIRAGGYTVLHYLYFYAMNDFRSSFYGVNDHEADWEQVLVYVVEDQEHPDDLDAVVPAWIAGALHDLAGTDLRRRWDDPALTIVQGTHPVVYAAAGSHASYLVAGEYLFGVRPRFLSSALTVVHAVQRLWGDILRQGAYPPRRGSHPGSEAADRLSVPFVDYARGDGTVCGVTGTPWRSVILRGDEPWLQRYRGLWGLDTDDPWGGERAPGGPKYGRNGELRRSWYDPLGFCGLDLVTPEPELSAALRGRASELDTEFERLQQRIKQMRQELRDDEVERVVRLQDGARHDRSEPAGWLTRREELRKVLQRCAEVDDARDAIRRSAPCSLMDNGGPRAHLRHAQNPLPPARELPWLGELWAATSGGLLVLLVVIIPALDPPNAFLTVAVAVAGVFGFDAVFRGQGVRFALSATVILAVIASALLIVAYWQQVLIGGIALFVLSMLRDNLRELRSLRHLRRRK